jgi:predicted secreted protein
MKKVFIIIPFLLALLASCEKADPDLIEAVIGESFNINLRANKSTGYHWSWINRDNIKVADSTNLEYIIDNPDLEGSPGTEVWTFEAKSAGEDTLIFEYLAPGSTGNGTENRKIRVLVHDLNP